MKKVKSLILIPVAVVTAFIVSLFAGCGAKAKTFNVQGMNITLTDSFYEQEIVTQTATFASVDEIVTVTKQSFSEFGSSSYSNKAYMENVAATNKLYNVVVEENDSYAYFTFTKSVSGKDYYYYATGRKGPTAYWLIQFACVESAADKHQPDFEKYAESVTFDGANTDTTV